MELCFFNIFFSDDNGFEVFICLVKEIYDIEKKYLKYRVEIV